MKAKIAWVVFLLMAVSLGGSSKNFDGKKQPHCFAGQQTEGMSEPGAGSETDEQVSALSPVSLFIFQLK